MAFTFLKGSSLVAQTEKTPPAMQETPVQSLVQEYPLKKGQLPTPVFLGFSGGSDSKETTHTGGDLGLIPGLEKFSGREHGDPLQYSCLENSMDREV